MGQLRMLSKTNSLVKEVNSDAEAHVHFPHRGDDAADGAGVFV